MAGANWQFILTDKQYRPVGEILNAKERTVGLSLNKVDSLSFKLRLDNPLADPLISDMGYIKAYRNKSLVFFGPVVSVEETGDTAATAAITAAGVGWMMTKRIVGKSSVGQQFTSVTDRAEIARQLIIATNTDSTVGGNAEMGIDTSTPVSSGSAMTYTAGPYRTLYDVLTELATGYDAFDWRILPIDNYSGGAVTGQKIGAFVARPLLGSQRAEAVFEYGTGRANIKSYSRVVGRDVQANRVYHFAQAGPDATGYPTVVSYDATSEATWRVMEDIAQADLDDAGMRQQLTDEHVRIRKNPRTIIQFVPNINVGDHRLPEFGYDYDVGDWVRARIAYAGSTRIDAWLRVWGVTFTVDDSGVESASTLLTSQDS